jgi:alanyl-tRNA synthetase
LLNSPKKDLVAQIEKLKETVKEKEKESKSLRQKMANIRYQKDHQQIQKVGNISVLTQKVEGLTMNELRELADSLKQKIGSGIVVLGTQEEKRAFLVVAVTKDLTNRVQASQIIKEIAPLVGGGGGGRPDFAQAGGTNPDQLAKVFDQIVPILEKMLPPKITPKED